MLTNIVFWRVSYGKLRHLGVRPMYFKIILFLFGSLFRHVLFVHISSDNKVLLSARTQGGALANIETLRRQIYKRAKKNNLIIDQNESPV